MIPTKNLSLLLNLAYVGFNRGLSNPDGSKGDFEPIFNQDGSVQTTFCNQFIQYICNGYGYDLFNGMNANQMHEFMNNPQNGWISVGEDVAQAHANIGVIVLASRANADGHGHVCLILPGILEKSGSWGKPVPKCANIGRDVFFGKKLSFSFIPSEMPVIFALAGMIS